MAFNIPEILDYYKNLLIIQYNNKEKARATVELNVKTLLQDGIICDVQEAYNLETAIGKQMDILGEYIGVNRFYSDRLIIGSFFGLTSYPTLDSDTTVGMTNYTNYATDSGGFATYDDIITKEQLNDDDYRVILKLKIIRNNSNHSHKSIDDGLFGFFGTDLIMSASEKMSMVYFVTSTSISLATIAFSKDVLPRPMGVKLQGLVSKNKKMFGFTNYNRTDISGLTTGFTNYTDGFAKEGEMLTYGKVNQI